MRDRYCRFASQGATLAIMLAAMMTTPARSASLFDQYQERPGEQFHLPTIDPSAFQAPTVFDVLNDGRIVGVATSDSEPFVFVESTVGSRNFSVLGILPHGPAGWPSFGGTFVAVSPSGGQIAVGNNINHIGVFDTADLASIGSASVDWYDTASATPFRAKWFDDDSLVFSHGPFGGSGLSHLDTTSSTAAPIVETIITGIDASADLAFDASGNLYTAEGFGFSGGAPTGMIKRFDLADWQAAIGGAALDFDADGIDVAQILSGGSLNFDNEGNLLVGGADFAVNPAQQNDFVLFRPSDATTRGFDPNDAIADEFGNFWGLVYNAVTGEIYAFEPFALDSSVQPQIDNTLVHVIRPDRVVAAAVPEPATIWLVVLGLAAMSLRRRR